MVDTLEDGSPLPDGGEPVPDGGGALPNGGGPLPDGGGPLPDGGGPMPPPLMKPPPPPTAAGTEDGSTARLMIPIKPAEILYPSERISTRGLWYVVLPWFWITPSTEIIAIVNYVETSGSTFRQEQLTGIKGNGVGI